MGKKRLLWNSGLMIVALCIVCTRAFGEAATSLYLEFTPQQHSAESTNYSEDITHLIGEAFKFGKNVMVYTKDSSFVHAALSTNSESVMSAAAALHLTAI